jgi:NADH:ubiquinone oxidoreductase subunit D
MNTVADLLNAEIAKLQNEINRINAKIANRRQLIRDVGTMTVVEYERRKAENREILEIAKSIMEND